MVRTKNSVPKTESPSESTEELPEQNTTQPTTHGENETNSRDNSPAPENAGHEDDGNVPTYAEDENENNLDAEIEQNDEHAPRESRWVPRREFNKLQSKIDTLEQELESLKEQLQAANPTDHGGMTTRRRKSSQRTKRTNQSLSSSEESVPAKDGSPPYVPLESSKSDDEPSSTSDGSESIVNRRLRRSQGRSSDRIFGAKQSSQQHKKSPRNENNRYSFRQASSPSHRRELRQRLSRRNDESSESEDSEHRSGPHHSKARKETTDESSTSNSFDNEVKMIRQARQRKGPPTKKRKVIAPVFLDPQQMVTKLQEEEKDMNARLLSDAIRQRVRVYELVYAKMDPYCYWPGLLVTTFEKFKNEDALKEHPLMGGRKGHPEPGDQYVLVSFLGYKSVAWLPYPSRVKFFEVGLDLKVLEKGEWYGTEAYWEAVMEAKQYLRKSLQRLREGDTVKKEKGNNEGDNEDNNENKDKSEHLSTRLRSSQSPGSRARVGKPGHG